MMDAGVSRSVVAEDRLSLRRALGYPVFVFLSLYLFSVAHVSLNPDADFPDDGALLVWTLMQTGVACMLVASLVGVLGRMVKIIHLGLLVLMVGTTVGDLVELYLHRHFNNEQVGGGCVWLSVLRNSSFEEVSEFLSCNVQSYEWLVLVLFLLAVVMMCLCLITTKVSRPTIRSSLCCLGCCGLFLIAFSRPLPYADLLSQTLLAKADNDEFEDFKEGFTFKSLSAMGKIVPPQGSYIAHADKTNQPFGVIVIGESATRRHWSLYGYRRRTTPRLAAYSTEIVVFDSVRASHWRTIQAMMCMLTGKNLQNAANSCMLPSIIQSVGLTCTFFSGQDHWGYWEGADDLFFSQCVKKTYLSDLRRAALYWDYDLIGQIEPDILNSSGVNACFVHLKGSHFEYSKRCPPEFAIYSEETKDEISVLFPHSRAEMAAYDNSIAYTDRVVGDMIDLVRKNRQCSFVLYVSDHGETPETTCRDLSQESLWEVPMVIWFSDGYRTMFPEVVADIERRKDEPMTNAAVFGLVLELLRIHEVKSVEINGGYR